MLSVIIVNFNVRCYLEQCLCSVEKALQGLEGEIIVVDNGSTDGSLAYLPPRFPKVKFIDAGENLGFARGCNRGWRAASGDQILFLNPDTLLGEDSLHAALEQLSLPGTGAVGIRMMDGQGRYLPESKRGFPGPFTSFFKLTGLIKIFPRSAFIARYYLGNLPETENHEVEILAGAFMLVSREALEKTGGFDERFFMYAEDVDLSWRILQAGYRNRYLGTRCILHFKGESTPKDLLHLRHFYGAMILFIQKHYGKSSFLWTGFLRAGVRLRALLAMAGRAVIPPTAAKPPSGPVLVIGGAAEAWEAKLMLLGQGRKPDQIRLAGVVFTDPLTLLGDHPPELVFCEGEMSYCDILDKLPAVPPGVRTGFHGSGSGCIVGSGGYYGSGQVAGV